MSWRTCTTFIGAVGVWPKVVGQMRARRIQSQKELRLQSRKGFASLLPPNFVCWLGILVVGSGAGSPGITIGHSGATNLFAAMATGTGTASSGGAADAYTGKADSYVPTFNGKQGDYREYRRRCDIYQMKMKLANREKETVFNLVTLLQGRAWDCVEDLTWQSLRPMQQSSSAWTLPSSSTPWPSPHQTLRATSWRCSGRTARPF